MDQLGLTLTATAYGYLQSNVYQNPELYHESVAHFSKSMGNALFIKPIPPSQSGPVSDHHHPHLTNTNDIDSGDGGEDHGHTTHGGCGHHDDEITSIEQYYPGLNVNSHVFSVSYESKPQSDHIPVANFALSSTLSSQPSISERDDGSTRFNPMDVRQLTTIPMSEDDHKLDIGLNDEICYLGLDASILHLKFIITGDQNAGKSTFLHSLTNSYDDSFLLLNRYLPILQGSFYNARLLDRTKDGGIERFIDEYPFIDTDIGLTQLFVTTDDLLLCLDDLATQHNQQEPPQQHQQRKQHDSGNKRTRVVRKQILNPRVQSFDLYQDFLKCAKIPVNSMITHGTIDQNVDRSSKGGHQVERYYPHVCLEFVELGGDHLDRLAQHLCTQPSSQINHIASPNTLGGSCNDHPPFDTTSDRYFSFVQQLCQAYQFLQDKSWSASNRQTALTPSDNKANQLMLSSDHTSQAGIDSLLTRTISLMRNTIHQGRVSDGLITPLSYFSNLEMLCEFPPSSSSTTDANCKPTTHYRSQSTVSTIHSESQCKVSPRQYLIMLLRMLLLLLVQHQDQFQQSFMASTHSNSELNHEDLNDIRIPTSLTINTHLLRCPLKFYNSTHAKIDNGFVTPQFNSPFNTHLINYQSKSQLSPHDLNSILPQAVIHPDFIFNRGDLALPIQPVIEIDAGKALDELQNFLQNEIELVSSLQSVEEQDLHLPNSNNNKTHSSLTIEFLHILLNSIKTFERHYRPQTTPWTQLLDIFLTNSINSCLLSVLTHVMTLPSSQSLPTSFPSITVNFQYSTHTFPVDSQKATRTMSDIKSEPGNLFLTIFSNIAQALGKK